MEKKLIKKEELLTPETITKEDVKRLFCANATDKELTMFLQIAKLNKLNPLKREIYLVKYKDNLPASILTGYEVYLKRASRTGQYGGFKVWVEGEGEEMKACIDVYRKDFNEPLHHEVDYIEYVQTKWDTSARARVPNKFWREKPKTMLKKVVISQALRFAFPDELAGMPYVKEEMQETEVISEVEDKVDFKKPEEITTEKELPGENPQTEAEIDKELEGIDLGDDPSKDFDERDKLLKKIYDAGNKKNYSPGTVRASIEKKFQKDILMVTLEELKKYSEMFKKVKAK